MTRKTKYYPTDLRDLPGDNFAFVKKALTDPTLIALRLAALPAPQAEVPPELVEGPESNPNALVAMLGLSPEQAKHLEGVDRINFWRNGTLHLQANRGSRGIKLACPTAVITDADLIMLFLSWGWRQLGDKLYFKANESSLVRL
ncbi:MAG: hypothetical protein L6R45_10220 [Anaerolineae bacterium]|nr:hypothetical protein [Anaerolineae bacterium]